MIYRNAKKEDLNNMCELWNEVVTEEYFLKTFKEADYEKMLLTNPDFSFDTTFVAYEKDVLVGFAIGLLRKRYVNNKDIPGVVNALIVKKEYRNQGIGTTLLNKLEDYFKKEGRTKIAAQYFLPSCYPWYIPNTNNHDHPCAPGIRVNSNEYFFYSHK